MTTSFTVDRLTFAAQRKGVLERGDAEFKPLVRSGLAGYDRDEEWYGGVRDAALTLWDAVRQEEYPDPSPVADAMREEFEDLLTEVLAQTTEPSDPPTDAEVDRLALWLSTFTVNSATMAAAAADPDADATLEWVAMRVGGVLDKDVRASHRKADGQVVPVGGTFEVDGHNLHHPGEPVGPPDVWINCRCVVRPAEAEGEFSMGDKITAAAAEEEPLEPLTPEEEDELATIPEAAWDDLEWEVPWHGILAPTGVTSGDGRRFSQDVLEYRDLPLPIKWMPTDQMGHDGSVVVGNVERIWEEDGFIKGEGRLRADSPDGNEVIDLVANRFLRGFSVDLDSAVVSLEHEDGSPFDMEDEANFAPDAEQPVSNVVEGRVASVTVCAIPAFQEAYIALGAWADAVDTETNDEPADKEALVAAAFCAPCEALAMIESVNPEHAAEFGRNIDSADPKHVSTVTIGDGTRYEFHDDGGMAVFAPGTKDGPGWVTNPDDTQRLRNYWVRGKGAAKIRWGQPGDFNRCRRQLAKYVPNPNYLAGTCANLHKEAIKVWPGQEGGGGKHSGQAAPAFALVASAAEDVVPAAWFRDPGLTEPTPITIDSSGRIYGHVATWDSCHIGPQYQGMCMSPPRSQNGYASYHQGGTVLTDDGLVRVANITMGTGHAGPKLSARAALAHYDNTGTAMAQVRAGEDDIGIWVSGAVKPGISNEEKYMLRASALSGDWRPDGKGNLEMIHALAVNVPGFPQQATTLAASAGEPVSLVASGVVPNHAQPEVPQDIITAAVKAALAEDRADQARKARRAEASAALREVRLERARELLQ